MKKKNDDPTDLSRIYKSILFKNPATAIIILDDKGIIRYINDYIEKISQYRKKDLINKNFSSIIARASRKTAFKAFRRLKSGKSIPPNELTILDKNGGKLYIKATASPIFEKGKTIGIVGFATDYTEQKKTIENLTKTVKELQLLYNIGRELTSTVNIDLLINKIILYLSDTFGYERTGILIVDPESHKLTIRASSKPLPNWGKTKKIKIGQGITGHVAKTGKPYMVNDISKDKRYITFDNKTKSEVAVPLKVGDRIIGVINVERYQKNAFTKDDIRILNLIANQAAIAIENSHLYESLEDSYLDTIRALVSAMEAKDHYTRGHSERVRRYAMRIAKKMQLHETQIKELNYAGYLHDIGKIGINDTILTKIEPLTSEEYELIKQHPEIGNSILKDVKHLSTTCAIIKCEHERYDGNGYPKGLKKNEIPIGARIIAVADAFDAMTTDRPYRKAISKKKAFDILKKEAGKQFDPDVVKAFSQIIKLKKKKTKSS